MMNTPLKDIISVCQTAEPPFSNRTFETIKLHAETALEYEQYNGWPNFETWLINTWIDNDRHSYNFWRERSQDTLPYELAYDLKNYICDNAPTNNSNMYSDLLSAALSRVDWVEVARHIMEER